MKLGRKLYIGFAIPTLCLAWLGIYSLISFANIDRQVGTIYDDRVVPLQQLKVISDDYGISVIDAVNKADAGLWTMEEALQSVRTAVNRIEVNWEAYKGTQLTLEEIRLIREVEQLFVRADRDIARLQVGLQTGNGAVVSEFNGYLYEVIDPLTEKINELINLQLKIAKQEREKAAEVYQRTQIVFIPLLSLALLIGSPLGFAIIRGAIAATLRDIINTLASTSTQIASATTEQEEIAQQQAGAVHQTSIVMEQLNQSAAHAAHQAIASATGAKQALSLTGSGTQAVDRTLEEMAKLNQTVGVMQSRVDELSQRATQIGAIAQLVSDLATQTRVLALNAAVEAVRAGEQGKGFGVVATEIRKLADQSHRSAEKINLLVTDIEKALKSTVLASGESSESVAEGIRIVGETAATFEGVRNAINQVAVNVSEISLKSKEQATAIQQVLCAMKDLDQGACQSASGITQVKIGTQRLKEAALHLKSVV
ncbi:HAMP domain-containing methyl-accepting chemotaxis protein [Laspinema olomoucense]|uniref:HAMP domain-containing methyl-accepting chemotaxis protein n=1 Tax=Laspinema olomoucense TaxID=3231600 RepID=UPI0021BB0E8A|nr:methyl-accepting chemotaxis protein [Laspinema sp. D3d]MCT7974405.1 methyl-accepting chemotaxis protein [Laspinema sp. D3d]